MSGRVTAAGDENASSSTRRIATDAATADRPRPTGERETPGRSASSSAPRVAWTRCVVSARRRFADGDSLMRVSMSCAGPEAASARLSFDRAPAACDGVRFDGKRMRPPCGEDFPAGFARAEKCLDASENPEFEGFSPFNGHISLRTPLRGKRKSKANGGARLARTVEFMPVRPSFGSETCFALSDDGADGFETRRAHAAAAGSNGNPARDGVFGRGRPNASAIRSSEKPAEGCEKWMRGDRTPTSPPKLCDTPPLDKRDGDGGAHSEPPPNPGEAPYGPYRSRPGLAPPGRRSSLTPSRTRFSLAPYRIRSGQAEAATSSASAPPFAGGGAKSRQRPSPRTEPESSAAAAKPTGAKLAFGDDECPALEAEVPLQANDVDKFAAASAPLAPGTRNRVPYDAIIVKDSVDAAQTADSAPPPPLERPGMGDRTGFRFMKENPGFACLALEGEGRLSLGFATSASAIIDSGFEPRKELAP